MLSSQQPYPPCFPLPSSCMHISVRVLRSPSPFAGPPQRMSLTGTVEDCSRIREPNSCQLPAGGGGGVKSQRLGLKEQQICLKENCAFDSPGLPKIKPRHKHEHIPLNHAHTYTHKKEKKKRQKRNTPSEAKTKCS